ncbi:hypothetical protein P3L10_028634 [Capsicum annuum]
MFLLLVSPLIGILYYFISDFCYRIGGTCSATKVQPEIGLGDCDTDVPFMTLCKEGYFVPSKPKVKAITVDKLPKPIIFHDGRLVQKPTPLMALLIILWIPFGFVLSCVRISIGSLLPISLYHYASWPSGIRLIIKGIPPSPIMKSEDKCSLFVVTKHFLILFLSLYLYVTQSQLLHTLFQDYLRSFHLLKQLDSLEIENLTLP